MVKNKAFNNNNNNNNP